MVIWEFILQQVAIGIDEEENGGGRQKKRVTPRLSSKFLTMKWYKSTPLTSIYTEHWMSAQSGSETKPWFDPSHSSFPLTRGVLHKQRVPQSLQI